MADRLIHILVPASQSDRLRDLIDRLDNVDCWHDPAGELALFAVQVPAEQVECVLDPVQASFGITEGFRAVVLPVEAILPREEETGGGGPVEQDKPKSASRISREELHADLGGNTRITPVFLTMVVLSTIVAAVGLANDSPAIVIGAMVMAPLLGPNMALSLATTLGDGTLAVRALRANGTGLLLAVFVALVCGLLLDVDPCAKEISCRIHVGPVDLVIALAAGVGGALAFTSGVPSSLIGVMVAVALLPPLVLFAMLLAGGHAREAVGALLLFGSNVISVNLAGVATFFGTRGQPAQLVGSTTIETNDPSRPDHLGDLAGGGQHARAGVPPPPAHGQGDITDFIAH